MRKVVLLAGTVIVTVLLPVTARAATRAYFVEPKLPTSAWCPYGGNVGQSFVANVDSVYYLEWFVAELSAAGKYVFEIRDEATNDLVCQGSETVPGRGWGWIRCDSFYAGGRRFTKGKDYILKISHDQGDSVDFVYRLDNPYTYGHIVFGGGQLQPPPQTTTDLVARIYGRMNPVDSAFWGMDEWCFVPWCDTPVVRQENRTRLRKEVAEIARSSHIGSIMTYARWPMLLRSDDSVYRHWEDFNARLYAVVNSDWADARPIVNITEVSRNVSSRVDTVVDVQTGETLFNAGYCAPRKLFEPVSSDSNYWAAYIRDLLLHTETDPSRSWPNNRPGDMIHVEEIWNEPNDTCVTDSFYAKGVTGWWRRPKVEYTSGYDDLEGLCRLYVRMASVAESVIHHQCGTGHQNDTILIGVTHIMLDSNNYYLARGLTWVRTCYQIATSGNGPGIFWDGISFHPYQEAYGFDPAKFELMAESVRAVARSFGDYDCQVWCSEVGVLGYDGFKPDSINEFYQQDANRYLPELYTTALASQALPGARYDHSQWWWFSTTDTRSCYGLVGLQGINLEKDSGDGSWQVFASCSTFQTLAKELTDLRFEKRVLADSSPESSRIYEFSDPQAEDGRLWVGWAVEPTGRGAANVAVKVPVRTDTVSVTGGAYPPIVTADADGWLRLTVSTQSLYMSENGNTHRPDLVVDSLIVSPEFPHVHSWMDMRAYVRNTGNRATPESTVVRFFCNDSQFGSCWIPESIGPGETAQSGLLFYDVPGWMHGQDLFRVQVNPGQEFVEKDGLDDNDGHERRYLSYSPNGRVDVVVSPLCKAGVPILPLRLENHSWESDSTGETPTDSARVLFAWYGQGDSVVHATDTTAWFQFCTDTVLEYPRGCGVYSVQAQFRDSGQNDSPFYGDSTDSVVVFDSVPPAGSIIIEDGGKFTSNSIRTLRLAASDSAAGVCDMRFMNRGRVNLVENGGFDPAGGCWSFTGGEYDSSLQMGKLSVGATQTGVRQCVPVESISAYAGDSCVLEASILAHVHDGDAVGDVSFWFWSLSDNPEVHDTLWQLVDSAGFSGSLLSLTGRYNLSARFLLSTPAPESGWVWQGGMVKVRAQGYETGVGTVWCDNVFMNAYEPQASGYAWWGPYDSVAQWDIGSTAGQHIVRAIYLDSAGSENEVPYTDTVILDPTPPVVDISLPDLGQLVSGLVQVTGWAYDPIEVEGDTWFKARMLSYRHVDSTNWLPVSPDSVSYEAAWPDSMASQGPAVHLGYWNTLEFEDGVYYLLLTASDSAGNTSSCTTWVVVANVGGGGGFGGGPPGGGEGMGEGSCYIGSATGHVLHLSDDLTVLDTFSVSDSGSQAYITAILEVGEDSLLILDAANKRVHKLHRNGQNRRRLVSNLSQPSGLARDESGNFYLVDRGLHRIGKFRSNGTLVFVRGGLGADSLHFHSPEGIAVKGGLVYVADAGNNRIALWDTLGNYKTTITGDFENPTAVWVQSPFSSDESGDSPIYLTDGNDGKLKGVTPLGGNIVAIGTTDSSKLKGLVPSENRHSLFSLASEPNRVYKLRI